MKIGLLFCLRYVLEISTSRFGLVYENENEKVLILKYRVKIWNLSS